jgi:hypothetical protein
MNTDYSQFTSENVEAYFNRCLFYGVWPGFFDQDAASKDPYWASEKKWYERDRGLFKRYIPLLQEVTTAGWEPVTGAECDNSQLWLERFGAPEHGRFLISVFNDTSQPQAGAISVRGWDRSARQFERVKLLHGVSLEKTEAGWKIEVAPQRAAVLEFRR